MNAKKVKKIRKEITGWRNRELKAESALNWKTLELSPTCGRYMYKMAKTAEAARGR